MKTLDAVIAESPVFAGLTQEQLEFIAGCAQNVHFDEGQQIAKRGDPADVFYLVRHGTVALETFVATRGPMLIEPLEPGEIVGWSWLFPPYRWHFDARTLTPVRATVFDGACLREKCETDPQLGYLLMTRFAGVLIDRLQWTRFRLLDLYGNDHSR